MRILGIDYGTKRIGIALSDPEEQFALPHKVIKNAAYDISSIEDLADEIELVANTSGVQTIVMGESRDYKGEPNAIFPAILDIKKKLESKGFKVEFELEFMTSQQAERLQGKNDLSDASAAALILQSYLDKKKNDPR